MSDFVFWTPLLTALVATWRMATPIIYAALGATISEKSGILNIGLEGIMLMGALAGFNAAIYGMPLFLAFLFAAFVGALCGMAFGYFCVVLKANQIVIGAAFNLLGFGITGYIYRLADLGGSGIAIAQPIRVPALADLPVLGPMLFQHTLLVYLTVPLALLISFVLYRTSYGLSLRASGDYPNALAAAGGNVDAHRFSAVVIGCALVAIGGAFLTLSYTNQFVEGIVSGRGFMALAVVILGRWTPFGIFGASLLFGFFFALQLALQGSGDIGMPFQVFQAMPYVLTIMVLVLVGGKKIGPRYLAVPFKR